MTTVSKIEQTPAADFAAVLSQAFRWQQAGDTVSLATVVDAWSMAPRRAGTVMAINHRGSVCGSIFPGAFDENLVVVATDLSDDRRLRTLPLQIGDDQACAAGYACGGAITVQIETLTGDVQASNEVLRQAVAAINERRNVVLCTDLSTGRRELIVVDSPASDARTGEALRRARADLTGMGDVEGAMTLFQVFNAPLRLFIVGAVNIAQALAPAAALLGFHATVIDPRTALASATTFTGIHVVVDQPDAALRDANLDRRSAVVTLSHQPPIDDPALIVAVSSQAFYVGALGSRRTHAARVDRLQRAGLDAALTARIHGPAGLNIGAVGPAEIAASIVAELIAVLRAPDPLEVG